MVLILFKLCFGALDNEGKKIRLESNFNHDFFTLCRR